MATDWRWCWTPKRLKRSNYYLYHRICLTINKIVYRQLQHLLVSFEELLSLRLSDHFALVVGCINNNWLNLGLCIDCFRVFPSQNYGTLWRKEHKLGFHPFEHSHSSWAERWCSHVSCVPRHNARRFCSHCHLHWHQPVGGRKRSN